MMRNVRLFIGLLCFTALFATTALAQFPVISAEDVKTWMRGKQKVVLIDTRLPEEYQQAHLPGAVSIPAERMKLEAKKLPKDKATPLIFYCRGSGCTLSRTAANAAMEMGYTYLMIYQAGMPDWLLQGNPVQKGDKPGSLK
jgi:rhodanese-related sulfurtransferase